MSFEKNYPACKALTKCVAIIIKYKTFWYLHLIKFEPCHEQRCLAIYTKCACSTQFARGSKTEYESDRYVKFMIPCKHRSAYAKFRFGVAPIRWNRQSRNNHCIFVFACRLTKCSLNPFMPSGFIYRNFLDRFISYIRGVWLVIIIVMFCRKIWT